jgi:two-component system, chemotaxis family, response regulator Rcp1
MKSIDILLVDDNPDDIELTREALAASKIHIDSINSVGDGFEAMKYLRREGNYANAPRPSVIFLDLNMPRKDGRQVLAEIKEDENFRCLPVVILTTSDDEEDVLRSYQLHANCYVKKPVDLAGLVKVVCAIDSFWFTVVEYPCK